MSLGDMQQSQELVFTLQRQVLEHCQRMGDRFAILDALAMADHEHSPQVGQWQALVPTDGALYYPWIRVEPYASGDSGVVPPCGHIAGIYARTDAQFGVHKAPANEVVEGALDLEAQLTDEEQSGLNDIGINCIRSFPRRGIRVWGARTLSGLENWRYVHVRRLFLTLTRWIEQHMRDVVFEPNAPPLWARVRDRLGAYCNELFQRGALKGARPGEGFFVKCDAETNPREVRDAGQLICDIGLAPIMPAEFIVVRLYQSVAGTTVMLPLGT
jgi:phage tail sheath protein FI